MSDKSAQTKKKLIQNADKITIAVLAAILLTLGYYWWKEQSSTLGQGDVVKKPVNLTDELAANPSLKMIRGMSGNPAIEQNADIARVAQLNMFDFSTLEQEKQVEAQAVAQFQQAQTLIKEGRTSEAHAILLNVQKVYSYNQEVKKALDATTSAPETVAVSPDAPVM